MAVASQYLSQPLVLPLSDDVFPYSWVHWCIFQDDSSVYIYGAQGFLHGPFGEDSNDEWSPKVKFAITAMFGSCDRSPQQELELSWSFRISHSRYHLFVDLRLFIAGDSWRYLV